MRPSRVKGMMERGWKRPTNTYTHTSLDVQLRNVSKAAGFTLSQTVK